MWTLTDNAIRDVCAMLFIVFDNLNKHRLLNSQLQDTIPSSLYINMAAIKTREHYISKQLTALKQGYYDYGWFEVSPWEENDQTKKLHK